MQSGTDEPPLGDLLMNAARAIRRSWVSRLADRDIAPHQARALRVIAQDHPIRPGRLAERLRVAPRSVTDVVDALHERGLIDRQTDPADRRAVALTLTDAGRTLAADIAGVRDDAAADYLQPLTAPDRAELARILIVLSTGESSGTPPTEGGAGSPAAP